MGGRSPQSTFEELADGGDSRRAALEAWDQEFLDSVVVVGFHDRLYLQGESSLNFTLEMSH